MRAATAFLLAVALPSSAACVACAEAANGPLAGASDAWASAPEPTSASTASTSEAPAEWRGYREVLQMPLATAAPFTSRGHLPEQSVDVRVNDTARASYTALVTDTVFPEGSQLAELSHNASGNGYVMRKTSGVWSYSELDAHGAVLASGALAWCATCHAQALADHVFGLPALPRSAAAP